jgi:putative transcriptional regulator
MLFKLSYNVAGKNEDEKEMSMSTLAGKFLIARPAMSDAFFGRSVILMLQHGPEGAFGLVLNRPAQAQELPFPIYVGGPCKMDGLLMIHGVEEWLTPSAEPSPQICPGVFLGTSDQFEKATEAEEAATDHFRVFTGYAGWGPNQLEAEMSQDAWIVLPASGETIFKTPVQDLWERLAPPTLPQPSMN